MRRERRRPGLMAGLLGLVLLAGLVTARPAAAASTVRQVTPLRAAVASSAVNSATPCPPVSGQPTGGSPKIMVVGDSISQGSSGDYTWRYRLYEHLVANGINPQMAGPYNWLFDNVKNVQGDCSYADPAFETAHDSTWGQALSQEMNTIQGEASTYQPDYMLVLLGINDLAFGLTDEPTLETDLKTFVASARAGDPGVKIVLGLLLPKLNPPSTLASQIAQYNNDMPAIASQLSTASSPVVVADDASQIDPAADLYDGTHPNANGEVKIAAGFANALSADFGLGSPYPTPYPVLPTGPQVPPQLSVTPGNEGATLTWTLSPGATGYWVYMKNVAAGETSFSKLPDQLTYSNDPWTAGLLLNGATYEFKLQACKGSDCGVYSNTVSVTPTGPAPAAPSGLSVTPGDGQATLSWTAAADATGYYVFMKNDTAGDTSFKQLPYPVSGTSWTAGLLIDGDTYEFELQSVDDLITGGTTPPVTVTPTGPAPDAPTGLSVTPGNGQATLTWTPALNATAYYVWEKNDTQQDATFSKLPYPVSGSSWTAGLLVNGGTYEFELQSVNGAILGGTTAPVTVTPTGPAPLAPASLAATAGDGQAVLTWTPASDATGYYVYEKNVTAGDSTFTKLPYPVTGSTWTAGLLVNGATYQFELQSVDGLIPGGTTSAVTVTPTAPPPPAPTGLAATAKDHAAGLAWNAAPGATGYYVYEKNVTAGDSGFTKLPYPVSGTSWIAGLLVNGATYQFELQSVNGLITGDISAAVTVVPTGPAPAAPANLAASPGEQEAVLTWSLPTYANCVYIYQRETSPSSTAFTKLPYPVCSDQFTAGYLTDGATYQFEVQAYDDLIAGGTSAPVSVTPHGPPPPGPESLTATPGNEKAVLHWSGASGATSYYIWQDPVTFGGGWARLPYPVSADWFNAGYLVNGATYDYKVQSVDGLEAGGYSNTVTVTPLGPTPEAPGDLSGSGSWHGTALLTWSTSWTATGYYVYVSDNGGSWTKLPYPVTGGSWTAGYLVPGHTYRFQLHAFSGLQFGGWSNIASVGIPLPPTPTGMSATTAGPYQAHLSWNQVRGADGYYIYMAYQGPGQLLPGPFQKLPYPVTANYFTVSYLFKPGIYYFTVSAIRYGAEGGQSNRGSMEPLMYNPMYEDALAFTDGQIYLPGSTHASFTAPRRGSNAGVVLIRAFIQPTDPVLWDIGDRRGYTAEPLVSSRVVYAWDTGGGRLGVYASKSCEQANPLVLCHSALPIQWGISTANDGQSVSANYVYASTWNNGIELQYQATQSQDAGLGALSQHIDGVADINVSGGSAQASILADHFPSYDAYQYPELTINGVPTAYTLFQCGQAGPGFLGLLQLNTILYGQRGCG